MTTDPTALIQTYWQRVWLDRDLDALDELVTDPTVRHTSDGTRQLSPDELKAHLRDALCAIRGKEMSVDAVTVDDPYVWLRLTLYGISLATMTPLTLTWLAQYRIEAGRIAETWALHQANIDWTG